MNVERGNQFLVSSVLVSLCAVIKVLGQILGPPFCSAPPAGGYGDPSSGFGAAANNAAGRSAARELHMSGLK